MSNHQLPSDYQSLLELYLKTRQAVDGLRQAAVQGLNFGFCDGCDLPYPDEATSYPCNGCQPGKWLCRACTPEGEGFGGRCGRCYEAVCDGCRRVCQRCEEEGCLTCVRAASLWRGAGTATPGEFLECQRCYDDTLRVLLSIQRRKGRASRKPKDRSVPSIRPAARKGAVKGVAKASRPPPSD